MNSYHLHIKTANQYMKNNLRLIILLVTAFMLMPCVAYANAGTVLIWFGIFHLLIGNLFLGLFEGILLSAIFKVPKIESTTTMMAANYTSALVGCVYLYFVNAYLKPASIYSAPKMMAIHLILLYIITVLVELRFVWGIVRIQCGLNTPFANIFKVNALVQAISYTIMTILFLWTGTIGFYKNLTLDPSLSFVNSSRAVIYYIADDGFVYKAKLDGSGKHKVAMAKVGNADRLIAYKKKGNDRFDLWTLINNKPKILIKGFAQKANSEPGEWHPSDDKAFNWDDRSFRASDMRDPKNIQWKFETNVWAYYGLFAMNENTKELIDFGLETPIASFHMRNQIVLPGDLVVFQVNHDQICVLDFKSRKVGLVARGRGPVVVLDD